MKLLIKSNLLNLYLFPIKKKSNLFSFLYCIVPSFLFAIILKVPLTFSHISLFLVFTKLKMHII